MVNLRRRAREPNLILPSVGLSSSLATSEVINTTIPKAVNIAACCNMTTVVVVVVVIVVIIVPSWQHYIIKQTRKQVLFQFYKLKNSKMSASCG